MTTKFFGPIEIPEDVIPHLAKKEHWKKGHSAYELAYSWVMAGGIPDPVSYVLQQADEFRDMKLIQGLFEKKTKLRDPGRTASQTDLLVLIGNGEDFAVVGVEGKVDEPFGEIIERWLAAGGEKSYKPERLSQLKKTLGLEDYNLVSKLRYQLFHRTAATIYEARNYNVRRAAMLVHSFSDTHSSFGDFRDFSCAIGVPVTRPNEIAGPVILEGVALHLGWVADKVSN